MFIIAKEHGLNYFGQCLSRRVLETEDFKAGSVFILRFVGEKGLTLLGPFGRPSLS
jgi:hypothetical protein